MTPLEKAIDKASELLAKKEDENEYHLHDVDRKWVIEAMMDYAEYVLSGMSKKPTSHIELSDEEIFNGIIKHCNIPHDRILAEVNAMIDGCKWYREQLKTINDKTNR